MAEIDWSGGQDSQPRPRFTATSIALCKAVAIEGTWGTLLLNAGNVEMQMSPPPPLPLRCPLPLITPGEWASGERRLAIREAKSRAPSRGMH